VKIGIKHIFKAKKKRPNEISKSEGHNKKLSGELRIPFRKVIKWDVTTSNLIISYKNQPCCLH